MVLLLASTLGLGTAPYRAVQDEGYIYFEYRRLLCQKYLFGRAGFATGNGPQSVVAVALARAFLSNA